MLRGHRIFLIDFNLSSKMKDQSIGGTAQFASNALFTGKMNSIELKKQQGNKCSAIDDWESFLYTMCYINNIPLKWLQLNDYSEILIWRAKLMKSKNYVKVRIWYPYTVL